MKRLLTGCVAVTALTLGGCIIIDADEVHSDFDYDRGWGSVYAADVSANSISVTVQDNGCTTKDFFEVDVDQDDDMDFDVGFDRIREDYCKMHNPDGRTLTWSYAELGIPSGAEVSIKNSVRR